MEHQVTTHYLAVSLALLSLACSLNLALLLHSSRGKIWPESSEDEPHPRACVEPLLYAIIALTVIEFFWTELGTYFAIKDFNRQRSADRPYNTEIVFISQNEGKSLRKDFQI